MRPKARCDPIERRRRAGAHPPRVAVVGQRVHLSPGGASEHRDEVWFTQSGHLSHRLEAVGVQLARRGLAHAPEPLHRQGMEERHLFVGVDHQQPVRLGRRAGHLRQVLGAGHPDGHRQAHLIADFATQPRGDLPRCAGDALQSTHVEERLVDGEGLHQRRGLTEHRQHRPAGLDVRVPVGLDDHRVGTQAPRPGTAHCRLNPVRLGLVARRQHHPAADDDGAPAQARIVPLLDRGEERVDVRVEDGGLRSHRTYVRIRSGGTHDDVQATGE